MLCLEHNSRNRRFRWIGYVLRMPQHSTPKTALYWTPPGIRKAGRNSITWRRTVTVELEAMGYTLGQAQYMAKDRERWRQFVVALCPIVDEEES